MELPYVPGVTAVLDRIVLIVILVEPSSDVALELTTSPATVTLIGATHLVEVFAFPVTLPVIPPTKVP